MKNIFLSAIGILLIIAAGAGWVLHQRLDLTAPGLTISPQPTALGARTVLNLSLADDGAGLKSVEVFVIQGDKQLSPFKVEYPVKGLRAGTGVQRQVVPVVIEARKLGLTQGPAELRIQVRDASWWRLFAGNLTSLRQSVQIDWRPPVVQVLSGTLYLNRGGAGLVIYKVEEEAAASGVKVGERLYPGHPCPSLGKGVWASYLAWPQEMETPPSGLLVVARDAAANEGKAGFMYRLRQKVFREDKLELSEEFLAGITAKLLPADAPAASPVAGFLKVNRTMREANHKTIAEICRHSQPKQLWKGPFLRLKDTAPMAAFGDRRSYLVGGREIDRQTHLGVDLASTAGAPVVAANSGLVVFADELGIYGNCVIIDHGQGVFSLYGHLSSIETAEGQAVKQGQIIGRTGSTGLAGGDHLHFSMLVNGTFVNPIEWWDSHWIKDNVELKFTQAKEALAPPPPPPAPGERRHDPGAVIF
jgi:murein DD-endopeptidase MepM/ murein hydrolase activator NlpD